MKSTYDSLDDIIVFDDFISPVYQDWLFFCANHQDLNWVRNDKTSINGIDRDSIDGFENGFTNIHMLYRGDELYNALNLESMRVMYGKNSHESELTKTFMALALEISELINAKFLNRMQIISTPQMGSNQVLFPHIDNDLPYGWSVIYYLNDSDGDTIIYRERCNNQFQLPNFIRNDLKIRKRISPKKGRAVAFKNDLLHSGSYPKYNSRFVVNMNFCEKLDFYESKKIAYS